MALDFQNTQIAFASKRSNDLRQSALLFRLMANPKLVALSQQLTRIAFWLHLPVNGLIKSTVFKQFCGGESVISSIPAARVLWQQGVGAILDYSVEGQASEMAFEASANTIMETIQLASVEEGVPLSVFKMTGLASADLLCKVSSQEALNEKEIQQWQAVKQRVNRITQLAEDLDVPLMVDAEESWIQDAIDQLVQEAMKAHNRNKVIIMNTIQCYRMGRVEYLKQALDHAAQNGIHYGAKLVRGAYMEKERKRAKSMGYPSPIQPDKAGSDKEFNDCTQVMLDAIGTAKKPGKATLVIASHNESSNALCVQSLEDRGWKPGQAPVWFAQLYGMSDHLSFNLAAAHHPVVKYLPFGPVKKVMPYLFRRAEENTSIKGQTGRELRLIQQELRRRSIDKS